MTRDKQLAVGALALMLFGGLAVKQFRDDSKIGSRAAQDAALPKLESTDGADKLTVTNGEKGTFVLEKKGENWSLVSPIAAKGNGQNIKLALDNIKELKVREQISSNPDADLLKNYELDAAKGVRVLIEKGGKALVDATFGKSGGRGQLLTVAGTPGIFAAIGFSNFLFTRDAKGWRDIEVLKFEDEKTTGLHYEVGGKTLDFALDGAAWKGTEGGKPLERFDGEKVKDALRSIKQLNADDFGGTKTDAELGLDKPVSVVTVTLKEGPALKVTVGGETASKGRWVKRDGAAEATALPSYAVDWLVPDAARFQKPAPDAGK